jgi:hypothetical protein
MNSKNFKQIAQELFDSYVNDFREPYAVINGRSVLSDYGPEKRFLQRLQTALEEAASSAKKEGFDAGVMSQQPYIEALEAECRAALTLMVEELSPYYMGEYDKARNHRLEMKKVLV